MTFLREDYQSFRRYRFERPPIDVDLSDNTNLWGTHPDALAAIRSSPDQAVTRYPTLYADELREQVARMYGVTPESVTTGCGSDDVLDSAIRAACRPPGLLTYAAPTFSMAEVLGRMNGLETRSITWGDALADPDRLLEDQPAALYLCSPNNPTGAPLPDGWLREFLEGMAPDGPLVILDEAYAEFEGRTHTPLAVEDGRVLVVRTLSKVYALAGLRVGYGIGRADLVDVVEKSRGPYKVGGVAERAAVAALQDASGWARRVVAEVHANRERLAEALRARGLQVHPSVTNFLLVGVAPGSALDLQSRLAARGVAVRPFPALPEAGDAIRVTVGPWPMMERFLSALDQALPG
jgi:histidinol-phosphate aminotransferase